ncbi:hypothetical protein AVEN_86789-1 [Araneus ventricosus]|uniref:Uncharacterized protein n=1 Tax=Araneus ventricosus TaxID=182803 RepID=A0A4Y2L682_ARAVE|nr:hypothetical protein AVEN_86789-1 [Araneus ventricosus]
MESRTVLVPPTPRAEVGNAARQREPTPSPTLTDRPEQPLRRTVPSCNSSSAAALSDRRRSIGSPCQPLLCQSLWWCHHHGPVLSLSDSVLLVTLGLDIGLGHWSGVGHGSGLGAPLGLGYGLGLGKGLIH